MMQNIFNSKDWPALPLQRPITKNSKYFKFKNKSSFIDVPNPSITNVYTNILDNCENSKDVNAAYNCAKKIVDNGNLSLSKYFNELYSKDNNLELFFKLQIYKIPASKKPILFGYHLNWKKFQKFIEILPSSDKIKLEDKYRYILACKYSGSDLSTDTVSKFRDYQKNLDNDSFKIFRKKFLLATNETVDSINNTLDGLIDFLLEKLKYGKTKYYNYSILDFIPDIISSLDVIRVLSNKGYISSCYREIRSLIERTSYVILDDYLVFNSFKNKTKKILLPLLNINSEWRDTKNKILLTKIDDLFPSNLLNNLSQKQKIEMENILLKRMSTEMYVALAGKPLNDCNNTSVPCLEITKIKNGIDQIKQLADNSKVCWRSLINEIEKRWQNSNYGEFPFPTTNFILAFLKRVFNNKQKILDDIWNRYSLFIHPYPFTWEVLPNTSVVEYKIFEYELTSKVEISIEILLNSLFDYLR